MKKTSLALGALVVILSVGCGGPKDTDPHDKIDAPGYYNGEMKPHGDAPATGAASAKPGVGAND